MTATPFEAIHTWDFVKRSLPAGCRRILEIGCGAGDLATWFAHEGL
jgi:2-polyprenyl-3-methyl-5-hydroxy-6-metoxy-1,4-benzoquinol methylase